MDYAAYLVKTNVYAYNKPKNKGSMAASSKNQYLIKTKEDLKAKFPDHDAWKNEEQWYPQLRKALEHGATGSNIMDPDIAYDTKCLPFYPRILNYYVLSKHRAAILHGNATCY